MKILTLLLLLSLTACSTPDIKVTKKMFIPPQKQFSAIWAKVKSDPVDKLPQATLSYAQLFSKGIDLITRDAKRTLSSHEDIIAPFNKLVHPNGVCLRGVWKINRENPYSGYFKKGSQALVIARASSAMSNTKRGETRAFGLAIKLFPTMDKDEILTQNSANIFTIDDLGGTDAEHFMDVKLTNEPDVSFTWSVFSSLAYALKVAKTFSDADRDSGIRQLYEISQIDENASTTHTPKWIELKIKDSQSKKDVEDFREEFLLQEGEKITYEISVSSREIDGIRDFQPIGEIIFDDSVVSGVCDHQLHFHHPLWKDNI